MVARLAHVLCDSDLSDAASRLGVDSLVSEVAGILCSAVIFRCPADSCIRISRDGTMGQASGRRLLTIWIFLSTWEPSTLVDVCCDSVKMFTI